MRGGVGLITRMVTRPNYLEFVAWGIRPKSRPRRLNALRCYLLPSFIYLLLVGVFATIIIWATESPAHEWEAEPCIGITAFAWYLGIIVCNIMPFRLENRFSNPALLRANLHDYRLAGIAGRDMLKGMAAPQLAGRRLFVITYITTCVTLAMACLNYFCRHPGGPYIPELLMVTLIGAITSGAAIFNLLVGSRYALAQWALCPSKIMRRLKTAGFLFSCPVTLCTFCPLLLVAFILWVPLECATLIGRSIHAENTWSRAKTALDGNDGEPFIEPIPKVTDSAAPADWRDTM